LKFDKLGLALSLISLLLLISAYGFYIEYDRVDDKISEKIAAVLRMFRPLDGVGLSLEKQSAVYVDEIRAIFLVYLISLTLGLMNIIRYISFKIRGIGIHNAAALTTFSIGLVVTNLYLIFTSGLLVDL